MPWRFSILSKVDKSMEKPPRFVFPGDRGAALSLRIPGIYVRRTAAFTALMR